MDIIFVCLCSPLLVIGLIALILYGFYNGATWLDKKRGVGDSFFSALLFGIPAFILCTTVLVFGLFPWKITGGVRENYRTGEVKAYIADVWVHNGVFFTTYEAWVYMAVDDNSDQRVSTDDTRFRFSTNDKDLYDQMMTHRNKLVNIKYSNWFLAPYGEGNSSNIIKEITPVEVE